jgi:dipeptidyl aminopeptidase/acylaminoacyl peptidase
MSPIRYADQVKTPTMIIHSDEDYRCSLEQAEQWFTALKVLGVPTELIIFPGEPHARAKNIYNKIYLIISDQMNDRR